MGSGRLPGIKQILVGEKQVAKALFVGGRIVIGGSDRDSLHGILSQ